MTGTSFERARKRGALPLACCIAVLGLFVWLRLVVFHDRIFPLSTCLVLLFCLWHRGKALLHGMAAVLTVATFAKVLLVLPEGKVIGSEKWFWLAMEMCNIWVTALVIHGLLVVRERLMERGVMLEDANAALEQNNHELAAREEEILRQNEELQSQTEELEQQSEELRQQAEELEQQGADMQELNRELMRREKGLETLLHSGRWMRGDMSESYVMSGVCQAAIQILNDVAAAEVVAVADSRYEVWGDCGFGLQGRMDEGLVFPASFAAVVADSQRTAGLPDIHQRADLRLPVLRAGRPLAAAIASPIWYEGKVVAVLCVYATAPREWTEHDFAVAEWLASQAALALQSARVQRELESRRRDAEEAALQKSRFLAAVSHDVRTPANAISLLAELLERASSDPALAARVPELARSLWTNARSLVDLVSDVLDLTRLDSGASDLHVTEFCLRELVDSEIFQAQATAAGKGLSVTCVMPEEPLRLMTDRTKLKRVIANLLGNAVKFTEQGGVTVRCSHSADGVRLAISDTGPGIPSHSIEKVFDEFFQLRNPERNRDKGAGLGLAIARRLVAALGCTLVLESSVGEGSTFTIIIPAGQLAPPLIDDDGGVEREAPRFDGLRILLVEDNDTAREAVRELLVAGGAEVQAAADGGSALNLLRESSFDVLLLDLNLPDMDGSEVLKQLTGIAASPGLRKIVISGDARAERFEQVRALGADEVLAKPVSLARIRAAIGTQ
jgi:signal transduction histidine kinase/CheY-like chemotaxis protein